MSSVGIAVNSKEIWKGTDYIDRKLGSVLDRKVASSSKQVLLERIEFKEASNPDRFHQQLKKKYTPLNSSAMKLQSKDSRGRESNFEANGKLSTKDDLPRPKFVLFGREKVKLNWEITQSVGPGLFNLGNTCFLNSVIQVLTYTPPLVNYLATQEHSKKCASVGFCMLCELQRHVLRTFSHSQNEAIKPLAILQKLKYIAKHLRFGQQEDSHEFLRYVVDGMMKSCLAGVSEKLDAYTKATTMVHQVFGGYYRSQVTCEKCHHTSNTYDPLMEVLLDIKHAYSVMNALHKLISVELLNGDNMYLCPRCKRKVPAKKHLRVHQAPSVLTMCLKRFDSHSLFGTKINKDISYPEDLNLRPFMSKNQGPAIRYKLYAVLVHSGYSCNSGHYYCFIKAANNHWYQMNDSSVRQVSLKTVLRQQAYLLFYIKNDNTQSNEKTNTRPQPGRTTWTNGVKPQELNKKQPLPKVIRDPTKKPDKTPVQFPKAPEAPLKPNLQSVRQFTPRPTTIPQQREKITFALNHGTHIKKPDTDVHKTTDGDERACSKEETKSSTVGTNGEKSQDVAETLQVNEVSSSVKESEKEQDLSSASEKKQTCKQDVTKAVQATTKWTVTKHDTAALPTALLPGALLPATRERTPSITSELSNPGSVASKTGEWSVLDRSTTQDVGPRLPERQHAGWQVSTADSSKKASIPEAMDNSRRTADEEVENNDSRKKHKKRKHSKEKSERKRTKKSDDDTKPLSAEGREHSEDEEVDERGERKMKRVRKLKKAKKRKSGDGSSSEEERRERRKRHKKAKKKRRKERHERISDEDSSSKSEPKGCERDAEFDEDKVSQKTKSTSKHGQDCAPEFENTPGQPINNETDKTYSQNKLLHRTKGERLRLEALPMEDSFDGKILKTNERNLERRENTEKERTLPNKSDKKKEESEYGMKMERKKDNNAKIAFNQSKSLSSINVPEGRKRREEARKPLVEYSDDSSSEADSGGESRIMEDTSRTIKGTSWSSEEKSRESHERRSVVETLLENSRKTSKYGCLVERWDGERDRDSPVRENEDRNKRRRDFWDEEYDRGKVKRTKSKEKLHNHSYHGENSFQREYDRKRLRTNGLHSSSFNGWHKRNTHHSRRDRR